MISDIFVWAKAEAAVDVDGCWHLRLPLDPPPTTPRERAHLLRALNSQFNAAFQFEMSDRTLDLWADQQQLFVSRVDDVIAALRTAAQLAGNWLEQDVEFQRRTADPWVDALRAEQRL